MDNFENAVMTDVETPSTPVDAGDDFYTDELPADEAQQDAPEQTATEQGVGDQAQGEEKQSQKDIGKAFAAERRRIEARERARYEEMLQNDPARMVGHRMLTDLMHRQGISMEQAAQMMENNFIKAFAEREGVSEYAARMILSNAQRQGEQRSAQQPTSTPDIHAAAARVHEELATAELPDGFDFDEAIKDEEFAQMLVDGAPVKVAASFYMRLAQANQAAAQAPQKVADQLRARQSLPQQMKPQQPITPTKNFMEMSDAEFMALDRKIKKGW